MTASVASWSMTTSSAKCFSSVIIMVLFGTNKAISHILFSLKCHKNGVSADNTAILYYYYYIAHRIAKTTKNYLIIRSANYKTTPLCVHTLSPYLDTLYKVKKASLLLTCNASPLGVVTRHDKQPSAGTYLFINTFLTIFLSFF